MARTMVRRAATLAATALVTGLVALPTAADATPDARSVRVRTEVTGLVGPLNIGFHQGRLYVADAFAGQVVRVNLNTDRKTVLADNLGFSPGVDVAPNGSVLVTASREPRGPGDPGANALLRITRSGAARTVADLLAFELAHNPDRQPQTQDDTLANPYAVLALPGRTLVADAGGNDILVVSHGGKVRLLTVLPVIRTGQCATATNNGVPNGGCDSVPTGIAIGPDGYLYVSGLGGEVVGRIWKIDLRTRAIVKTFYGFPPLTGIAVGQHGMIYASSLFANTVFRVRPDGSRVAVSVPGPTGIAIHDGRLFAGSVTVDPNAPPAGKVVSVPLSAFF